ncbi:MAG: branched-chain amino acid ABC transporter substrate-binding protein [Proteobacteria bacterium]|nr:branched-chain amino acid ABC transporter substrate-binding protein [Pseudomonadota bacterium]MBS0554182.1 branched-chain amino acid ABC transporter substrate-binding protein [Pseudomonadota bacterium]
MSFTKKLCAALLVGVAAQSPVWADEPNIVRIVTHSPLSGPQSLLGEAIKFGAQLAVEQQAKELADLGFKVVLQPEDDQATPNVGVANANRFVNDAKVLAVVGHYNSSVAIPASEIYSKVGLTMISPANNATQITDRTSTRAVVNRLCGRDDVLGPVAARFATDELKARTAYVINDKSAYGSGLAGAFEKAFRAAGGKVSLSVGIDDKETDFSSILNRAGVEKPDLIFYGGFYPQGGLLIKQMRQKGVAAAWMSGDGVDSVDLQKIAGAANMRDTYFATSSVPVGQLPAGRKFVADYKEKFGKAPEGFSAFAYDSASVALKGIANAVKANGGKLPARSQVAAEVRNVKLDGVTGSIAFNPKGDVLAAKYAVIKAEPSPTDNKVIKILEVAAPL